VDVTLGYDFISICDQKMTYRHGSCSWLLLCYGWFFILVLALQWTAPTTHYCILHDLEQLLRTNSSRLYNFTRSIHNRVATCLAAEGGSFENLL